MARDSIHFVVTTALEKDGWTITDDPFILQTGDITVDMDLAAEKIFQAERGAEKIIVEIKSFTGRSLVYEFHAAIGQYIDYRGGLKDEGVNHDLFLAVSEETFDLFESIRFFKRRLEENLVKLIVVDLRSKTISRWIK